MNPLNLQLDQELQDPLQQDLRPYLFKLITDVQKLTMDFLEPTEIKTLYETYEETKVMFDELTTHTNFIVVCKSILSNEELQWFELKNINLKLLETYRIDNYGTQYWYKNGERHRDNDLPAIIDTDGNQFWYNNGDLHRDNDLPALLFVNGFKQWYQNGIKYIPTSF